MQKLIHLLHGKMCASNLNHLSEFGRKYIKIRLHCRVGWIMAIWCKVECQVIVTCYGGPLQVVAGVNRTVFLQSGKGKQSVDGNLFLGAHQNVRLKVVLSRVENVHLLDEVPTEFLNLHCHSNWVQLNCSCKEKPTNLAKVRSIGRPNVHHGKEVTGSIGAFGNQDILANG